MQTKIKKAIWIVIDASTLPASFAGVTSIPATFFIDRDGAVKLAADGLVSLEEARAVIEANEQKSSK